MLWPTARAVRVGIVLGTLAALLIAALAFVSWGSITEHLSRTATVPLQLRGRYLPHSFRLELLLLSAVIVAVALVAFTFPFHPLLPTVAGLAAAAQLFIVVRLLTKSAPFPSLTAQGLDFTWSWGAAAPAAIALSGVGVVSWSRSAARLWQRRCPDCAERAWGAAERCRHCGYGFPLRGGLKRCDACGRTVKSAARVCRHCHQRFDSPSPVEAPMEG
jgi:hypothetical protein